MQHILLSAGLITLSLSSATIAGDMELMKAILSENRTDAHIAVDPRREPFHVLKLAGVAAGMTVLDINSAGGYYSSILSNVVGEDGKVYAHNGNLYWKFIRETFPEALEGRANVVPLNGKEVPDVEPGSVDVALNALAYHDYYFMHEHRGEEVVADINKGVYDALKPGGVYIVVDHVGSAGMDGEAMNKLHRIDPERVKSELAAAGFDFAGEIDVLANPYNADDAPWFGVQPNYTTNRFVYKFVKK